MKMDIFAHNCPKTFIHSFSNHGTGSENLRDTDWPAGWPMLWDVEKRLAIMESHDGYAQVLVPTGPPPGIGSRPGRAGEMARVFNDGLVETAAGHPERFLGVVACPRLDDVHGLTKTVRSFFMALPQSPIFLKRDPSCQWDPHSKSKHRNAADFGCFEDLGSSRKKAKSSIGS